MDPIFAKKQSQRVSMRHPVCTGQGCVPTRHRERVSQARVRSNRICIEIAPISRFRAPAMSQLWCRVLKFSCLTSPRGVYRELTRQVITAVSRSWHAHGTPTQIADLQSGLGRLEDLSCHLSAYREIDRNAFPARISEQQCCMKTMPHPLCTVVFNTRQSQAAADTGFKGRGFGFGEGVVTSPPPSQTGYSPPQTRNQFGGGSNSPPKLETSLGFGFANLHPLLPN